MVSLPVSTPRALNKAASVGNTTGRARGGGVQLGWSHARDVPRPGPWPLVLAASAVWLVAPFVDAFTDVIYAGWEDIFYMYFVALFEAFMMYEGRENMFYFVIVIDDRLGYQYISLRLLLQLVVFFLIKVVRTHVLGDIVLCARWLFRFLCWRSLKLLPTSDSHSTGLACTASSPVLTEARAATSLALAA